MAVLKKGESNYPFWGESVNLITGLDPLGLQTTSEATYSNMLQGISNQTNRLRYYGFYCWLLDFYFKKEIKGNSIEQYRFIRRAELMITIIMKNERSYVTQIAGSNFDSDSIYILKGNYFDLAQGADKNDTDNKVYWKYKSGAFGQYYYGPMQALSLIVSAENEEKDSLFNVSQPHPRQKVSGKQLADTFGETLTPNAIKLFYETITNGKLYKKDIQILITHFNIDRIDAKSKEWQLYTDMLLDKDDPSQEKEELFTFHRRETILSLINIAAENKNTYDWHKYLMICYKNKLGTSIKPETDTNIGWYCYQLNEYWQYACGGVFWAVLRHLYDFQQDQYLPSFVKEFSETISEEICKSLTQPVQPSSFVSDILELLPKNISVEETKLEIHQTNDPIIAAKYGFIFLFQLLKENIEQLHEVSKFIEQKQIIRDGNMVEGILAVHESKKETLQEFVENFISHKIINRHSRVALRKMGNGSQSTHKFIIEEQYIHFIDVFLPRNTSPRMNALKNLLYDLYVIDSENELSLPVDEKILKN